MTNANGNRFRARYICVVSRSPKYWITVVRIKMPGKVLFFQVNVIQGILNACHVNGCTRLSSNSNLWFSTYFYKCHMENMSTFRIIFLCFKSIAIRKKYTRMCRLSRRLSSVRRFSNFQQPPVRNPGTHVSLAEKCQSVDLYARKKLNKIRLVFSRICQFSNNRIMYLSLLNSWFID